MDGRVPLFTFSKVVEMVEMAEVVEVVEVVEHEVVVDEGGRLEGRAKRRRNA